ncbi:MAG: ABC transporter permease [Propionibacteriaceae bacterium]|jgi:putative ABC transport system permease protein|nr:ABC transporter permease [Propionibacteriaceae bacterium]
MLVLVNAFKAITRSVGRNLLIMLIVAVIAAASAVALSIRHAAWEAETSGAANLSVTGTIGVDRQKLMESVPATGSADGSDDTSTDRTQAMDSWREAMQQYPDLTVDQLRTYADSSYVQEFLYSSAISVNTTGDVEAVSTESTADESDQDSTSGQDQSSDPSQGGAPPDASGGFAGGPTMFGGRSMGDLTITGYGSQSAMTDFVDGTKQITDGAMVDTAEADNTCVVSDEFATYNSLAVGDTITVSNPAEETQTYTLTIVGLYHADASSQTSSAGGPIFSTAQDSANQIIASYPTVAAIEEQSAAVATDTTDSRGQTVSTALTGSTSGSYVFANPDAYHSFETELVSKGLDSTYVLSSADLDSYEASLVPLQNLSSFASTLLWIVLGVGAAVLVTIAVFSIRERKYEVGVLTAIGVSKPKVALQFVVEMFLVALVGLVVGLGIGAAVSPPIAETLLSAQVAQQEAQTSTVDQNFGRMVPGAGPMAGPGSQSSGFGQAVEYINQINATLDWTVMGQLAGIGLGLAVVASIVGVVFVLRYEPLTILSNRS